MHTHIVEFTKIHSEGVLSGLTSPGQRVGFCSLASANAFADRIAAKGAIVTFVGVA